MTDAQRVALGREIEPDVAARAEARRLATLKQNADRSGQMSGTVDAGEARDEVARTVGIGSGRTPTFAAHAAEVARPL